MDIANQLFSVTLGIEPNKQTLQNLAGHLSTAVKSLSERQKDLITFADNLENQKFISNAPTESLPLSKPQIQYIEAAPTEKAKQARKAKVLRDPVVWQITQQQLKELQWKQKQLVRAQKAELERKKEARKLRPPPKKLGQSKANNVAAAAAGEDAKGKKAPQGNQGKGNNVKFAQQANNKTPSTPQGQKKPPQAPKPAPSIPTKKPAAPKVSPPKPGQKKAA